MGAIACSESWTLEEAPGRKLAAFQTLYQPGRTVEVAATSFGPGMPGVRAYHTSVMVDDVEYSFSMNGITQAPRLASHQCYGNQPMVMYKGLTSMSSQEMLDMVGVYFRKGSYDLLRKNCNSFSDCALYCLLDRRLDPDFSGLEKLGHSAEKHAGLVQVMSDGAYRPNPLADGFDTEAVVREVNLVKTKQAIQRSLPLLN
jgi:hypothetical protein